MEYSKIPLIKIKIPRGQTEKIAFVDLSLDGTPIDFTDTCPKVQFKSTLNPMMAFDFELNEGNGGLIIEPDRLTLVFGRITSNLWRNIYYGDLILTINGDDIVGPRFELDLSGTVTTKKSDEC